MINLLCGLVLEILSKINENEIFSHEESSDILDPLRNSGGKQAHLDVVVACLLLDNVHDLNRNMRRKYLTSSMSSLKPCFNITSVSSRMTAWRLEKSMFPLLIWSRTLPVVPTKMSTPLLSLWV